jgi:hypothetical protein
VTVIERSTGIPVMHGGTFYGMAGGGYRGVTAELDQVVADAAAALADWYGADVEIRFNSDRESGGAWLVSADGRNHYVGICASVVTAVHRARVERSATEEEAEARTGRATWQAQPMTVRQRKGARELAEANREWLAENPEGQLTVRAHLEGSAVLRELRGQLARLPGWNDMCGRSGAYHHGRAVSVTAALARCLRYVPSPAMAAALADWEGDGGA